MMASAIPADPLRHRDRIHGLLVVGLAFLLSLCISFWAKHVSEPEQPRPPKPPTIGGVKGFPHAVDPLATLGVARSLTRRTLLRGIVAEGVNSSGALDMSFELAKVRYSFQSPAGQGPQPPRVPGVVPRKNLCGRQNVWIRQAGIYADSDQVDVYCSPIPVEALPEPRCSLAQIWEHARRKGVTEHRLARIEYYRAMAGPAWRFELPDGSVRFSIYGDCVRELSRAESAGGAP